MRTIAWVSFGTVLALFLVGWRAASVMGIPEPSDGLLHGVMVWAVSRIIIPIPVISALVRLTNNAAQVAIVLLIGVTVPGLAVYAPEYLPAVPQNKVAKYEGAVLPMAQPINSRPLLNIKDTAMIINNLQDVFHQQLKDVYSAEKQLTEALPNMVRAASAKALKHALDQHLEITHQQMDTVRRLLDELKINPGNKKCRAMQGLIEAGSEMAAMDGDADARDAGIIGAAQKVEHYEIASYGTLRTWAQVLGKPDVAKTLQNLLDQEYEADNTLTQIAEGFINQQADS